MISARDLPLLMLFHSNVFIFLVSFDQVDQVRNQPNVFYFIRGLSVIINVAMYHFQYLFFVATAVSFHLVWVQLLYGQDSCWFGILVFCSYYCRNRCCLVAELSLFETCLESVLLFSFSFSVVVFCVWYSLGPSSVLYLPFLFSLSYCFMPALPFFFFFFFFFLFFFNLFYITFHLSCFRAELNEPGK